MKKKRKPPTMAISPALCQRCGHTEAEAEEYFMPFAAAALRGLRKSGADYAVTPFTVLTDRAGPLGMMFILTDRGGCLIGLREDAAHLPEEYRVAVLRELDAAAEEAQNN
jgi:hypothetical protein